MPVEIPDFTRGAWKTAKPVTIGSVDLEKMGYERKDVKRTLRNCMPDALDGALTRVRGFATMRSL